MIASSLTIVFLLSLSILKFIESVTDEKDAVRVNVTQADNAKKYELMFTQKATNGNATIGIPFQNERLVGQALGTSTTIVTDPVFHNPSYGMTFKPVDRRTYLVRVRGINSHNLTSGLFCGNFFTHADLAGHRADQISTGNRNHCFSRFDCFYQTFFIYCCDLRIG